MDADKLTDEARKGRCPCCLYPAHPTNLKPAIARWAAKDAEIRDLTLKLEQGGQDYEALAGLLQAYGDVREQPTESELIMGCKDGARAIRELQAELAALREENEMLRKLTETLYGIAAHPDAPKEGNDAP